MDYKNKLQSIVKEWNDSSIMTEWRKDSSTGGGEAIMPDYQFATTPMISTEERIIAILAILEKNRLLCPRKMSVKRFIKIYKELAAIL